MKAHNQEFSLEKIAHVLGVSRSGYYRFIKAGPSSRDRENKRLVEKIRFIHKESFETYGSPRVHAELKSQGEVCSRKRVAKLMRASGIVAHMFRSSKNTTRKSERPFFVADDLIKQDFKALAPDEAWVSDISYIPTKEGWLYCAIVLDLFSRKIVGLALQARMTADLVVKALKQALTHRRPLPGIVHHSDRGSQYTSKALKTLAENYGVQLSMGKVANAFDNAVAESFFHTLKTELVSSKFYKTIQEAKMNIFQYIHGFYNQKRRHSTLGYLSPSQFEKNFYNQKNISLSSVH